MGQFIELAIDSVGFLGLVLAWMMIIFAPIVSILVKFWSPNTSVLVLTGVGLSALLAGFFIKWIANGVVHRRRGRMLLLGITCLVFTVPVLLPSSAGSKTPQLYLASAQFLLAALVLLFGIFKKKKGLPS